ncbi:hypothetical protein [Lactococcus lactis]|uniref:hypothetical protein n=1 Tax=Lactococcus lactis TaxID=1358 RepID=UPI0004E2872E|nr:hypothetical protein [Lactococcus lactis]OJH47249.1 hypothetical protein LGL2_06240 [Lactococcus lactis subsp. lactis bv. diacetylactis]
MENEQINALVWNYYEPYQSVIALIEDAFDPFGYDEAISEKLTVEELGEDENYENLDPEVYLALTRTSENMVTQGLSSDYKVYSEQIKLMEMNGDFTYVLVNSDYQVLRMSDSLVELVGSPEFLEEVKRIDSSFAQERVTGLLAIVKEALSETQTFIEDGWEVGHDPYHYVASAEALLLENSLEEDKKYYAVYDTQSNDFRTLGIFETAEEAMEAGADYFVNVLDLENYTEMGGEAHFHHSTPQEDGELLGFTAVGIRSKEATWLNQATQTQSSIYYHDSHIGQGDTYKKFPIISLNRPDIYGRDLRTGEKVASISAQYNPLSAVLAREFLERALDYLRHNGELSAEERQEVEHLGTVVTPRTDQELHLILQNGWFDDLYDVFDDELSYFNTVNDAELTKLDIEHEISKYLEEHPFHLDLPTLYSLAQKGGNMSFVALYNSAVNGNMVYTDEVKVKIIYDKLIDELGRNELEKLEIFNIPQFQKILLTTQKEKKEAQQVETTLTHLSMIKEIKNLKKLASGKNEVLSVGGGLLDKDLLLQLVRDYQKMYPEIVELEDDNAKSGFSKLNEHQSSDFILSNFNRPQSVLYVGDSFETLLDVIQKNIPGVISEIRQEWSQRFHEIFDFDQEQLNQVQDWMMEHLKFTEHFEESVDVPIEFEGGVSRGLLEDEALRFPIEETTNHWVEYQNKEKEIPYDAFEIMALEEHQLPFEGIQEILEAVDLTIDEVVQKISTEKKMAMSQQELSKGSNENETLSYVQKIVDSTVHATGIIERVNINDLDYWQENVISQFNLSALTEKELVALSLNLIHQIYKTTQYINEMKNDDSERQDYLSDYENERDIYDLLVQEWEERGVNVPLRAAAFDANETEHSEPLAHYFEELLSDYLVKGGINFKEELPLPQKGNQSSVHLK